MRTHFTTLVLAIVASGFVLQPPRVARCSRCGSVAAPIDALEAFETTSLHDATREIFCNRELNMQQIEAVGFDMDYTLAQYNENFDLLAFDGACEKLVEMGYPRDAVEGFVFNPAQHRRGLVIDKELGNFLKVDRHKYVRIAYHGSRELSADERKLAYVGVTGEAPTFVGEEFVNVDSLFQLVDASLYAQLVDVMEARPEELEGVSYQKAFRDVRRAVDLCHHDGVIKDRVAEDPARYIIPDEHMVMMLEQYRAAGKKLFLLTNSLFDYTNVVMNFLTASEQGAQGRAWIDLFDVVIVGGCKPAFLQDARRDLLRVDSASSDRGTLHNLVGKPLREVGAAAFSEREGKVFQGGSWRDLHTMLSLTSGSELLYVGDHMFSDVVRSKRSLGWRTALVVPELEAELEAERATPEESYSDLAERVAEYDEAEYDADALRLERFAINRVAKDEDETDTTHLDAEIDRAETRQQAARDALRDARARVHARYHPNWGPLFRTGNQASRFAKQVTDYACVYTSRASNLARTSPLRSFRPPRDDMPHDILYEEVKS